LAPPVESFKIESRIPISPDLKLDFGQVSDFVLTVQSPIRFVFLVSNAVPDVSLTDTSINYSIDSTYTQYEQLSVTSSAVNLVPQTFTPPTLIATVQSADILSTKV
jgi:hypothetical protein